MKLVLLESDSDPSHPLKGEVASLALISTDFYARMLGCLEIEVQDPSVEAVPLYLALGFTLTRDDRLVIRIEH